MKSLLKLILQINEEEEEGHLDMAASKTWRKASVYRGDG